MFVVRRLRLSVPARIPNLNCTHNKLNRYVHVCCVRRNKQEQVQKTESEKDELSELLKKYEGGIIYSGYIEREGRKHGYAQSFLARKRQIEANKKELFKLQTIEPLPLSLKYLLPDNVHSNESVNSETIKKDWSVNNSEAVKSNVCVQFPFENSDSRVLPTNVKDDTFDADAATIADVEIKTRLQLLNNSPVNWMTDYDNYDDKECDDHGNWQINYGTPNPKLRVSDVPCGGCGALLHCKDTSIPGYIPSEIFRNHKKRIDLKQLICQRCHFLKMYNLALQVRVTADDYPQVLRTIADRRRALVILMVDLLDFPCSIWPGIADLLGPGRPVYVVGNKVDMLPQDGKGFLERVTHVLENLVCEAGFATTDIKGVSLISAKTGYGIEDLITKLFSVWKYEGDVFLVGCTNVGKSSLFNVLLQSDYCKAQAADLIQRATTSMWPGTTLNLLKFPIMRPSGWRMFVRQKRLISASKLETQENKLRRAQLLNTRDVVKYATLIGQIDRTFNVEEDAKDSEDPFVVQGNKNSSVTVKFGIDENNEQYVFSKWCYDTPGVVQDDQIIHLLTTEELMLTLPKELLTPQTFTLKPGSTIYIAGLGRLDYIDGDDSTRFTVFCSSSLPITICTTDFADRIYEAFLGTELFVVPIKSSNRLKFWPRLQCARDFTVKGIDWECSSMDVMLSNAGWIAVTCGPEMKCTLRAWTPEKRGVHLRESLIPKAVALRGKKIRGSPAYKTDKFYVQK